MNIFQKLYSYLHLNQTDDFHLKNKASNIFHISELQPRQTDLALTKKYGHAEKINFSIKLLVIADTHNKLAISGIDKLDGTSFSAKPTKIISLNNKTTKTNPKETSSEAQLSKFSSEAANNKFSEAPVSLNTPDGKSKINSEASQTSISSEAMKSKLSEALASKYTTIGKSEIISEAIPSKDYFRQPYSKEPSEASGNPDENQGTSSEASLQRSRPAENTINSKSPAKPFYDVCVFLGDVSKGDIRELLKFIPKEKIIGVLGNHDDTDNLEIYNIENINGKKIEKTGINFLGIEGCVKYKDSQPGYTLEESYEFFKDKPPCDILISHTIPFMFMGQLNNVHIGNPAINEYLIKTHCPLAICGHNHSNREGTLENGTNIIETYDICLIDISPEEIKIYKKED